MAPYYLLVSICFKLIIYVKVCPLFSRTLVRLNGVCPLQVDLFELPPVGNGRNCFNNFWCYCFHSFVHFSSRRQTISGRSAFFQYWCVFISLSILVNTCNIVKYNTVNSLTEENAVQCNWLEPCGIQVCSLVILEAILKQLV